MPKRFNWDRQNELGLYVDITGRRLLPKHDRFAKDMYQMSRWGHSCQCCGIGCTPELLKDEPWALYHFEVKRSLENKFDIRSRKFQYLHQRHAKMFRLLQHRSSVDEIYWTSVGNKKDDNRRWWVRMVEAHMR